MRRSCSTNTASRISPPIPGPHTWGLVHPTTGWRISASTGPASPKNVSTAPSQSTRACVEPGARGGTAIDTIISVAITNGMFTAKINRHDTESTR